MTRRGKTIEDKTTCKYDHSTYAVFFDNLFWRLYSRSGKLARDNWAALANTSYPDPNSIRTQHPTIRHHSANTAPNAFIAGVAALCFAFIENHDVEIEG